MTLIWSLSSKKLFTSNYKLLDTKKQISHVFLSINIQIEYSGDLNILISWKDIKNCQTYNFYHTKNYTTSSSNEIRFETDFTKKQSAAVGKKKKKKISLHWSLSFTQRIALPMVVSLFLTRQNQTAIVERLLKSCYPI